MYDKTIISKLLRCCSTRPRVQDRELLSEHTAADIEALFKVLGNRTRLRMLHAMARCGEVCVSDLAEAVGMKQQAVSNQLQRLVDRGILASRRNGNHILYRIEDPCVVTLLDQGLCLLEEVAKRQAEKLENQTFRESESP